VIHNKKFGRAACKDFMPRKAVMPRGAGPACCNDWLAAERSQDLQRTYRGSPDVLFLAGRQTREHPVRLLPMSGTTPAPAKSRRDNGQQGPRLGCGAGHLLKSLELKPTVGPSSVCQAD
jgi:hypothetical protein